MIPFLKKNKDGKKPPKSTVPRTAQVFWYMAKKNMGSITAIMPRVAPELPAVSRRTKNSSVAKSILGAH